MNKDSNNRAVQIVNIEEKCKVTRPTLSRINATTIRNTDNIFMGKSDEEMEKIILNAKTSPHLHHMMFFEMMQFLKGLEVCDANTYERQFDYGLHPYYSTYQVAMMDALLMLMQYIDATYGKDCVFIQAVYEIKEKEVERDGVTATEVASVQASYTISSTHLATYLLKKRYVDDILNSSFLSKEYYYFSEKTKRWSRVLREKIEQSIRSEVQNIIRLLNADLDNLNKMTEKTAKTILNALSPIEDTEDILALYSHKNPFLIQFKDMVYDMESHKIAKMDRRFMLNQYHDYHLNVGTLDTNTLTAEDGFVDVPITIEEARAGSQLMLKRLTKLHSESQIEFLLTILGNVFHRKPDLMQVFLMITARASAGKSWVYNFIADNMIGNEHSSALKQAELDSDSQFKLSSVIGSNINIIGELKGTVMTKSMIDFIKSSSDKRQIEEKNKTPYSAYLRVRTIALSNYGHLPQLSTTDVTDDGLKRRIVVMDGVPVTSNEWQSEFTTEKLSAEIPSFAMLCMMTFMKHLNNNNIEKFRNKGAIGGEIEGFLSKDVVDYTQKYFNGNDRYRMFFVHMFERFIVQPKPYPVDEEMIILHFAHMKVMDMAKQFTEWHEQEYKNKRSTSDFRKAMTSKYGVSEKRTRIPNSNERRLCYGRPLGEVVLNILIEDNFHSVSDYLSDDTKAKLTYETHPIEEIGF